MQEPEEIKEVDKAVEKNVNSSDETVLHQNAVSMAKNYLDYTAFSESGFKFQGFNNDDVTHAVNTINAIRHP